MEPFKADPNTWYHITESVVGFTGSLGSASAPDTDAVAVFIHAFNASDPGDSWQIFSLTNTTFAFRSRLGTSQHQLDVSLSPVDTESGQRQLRLSPTDPMSLSQQWTIQRWKDREGTWKLQNLAKGTSHSLAVHDGIWGPPIMSSVSTEEGTQHDAQHWMFSSMGPIDDVAFSTTSIVSLPSSMSQNIALS
jgi:hypothetical protein